MIELQPFLEADFDTFKSWIKSEEQLIQFAGPIFSYPISNKQLVNYINSTDKKPYKVVLTATKTTIGHCELNFENGHHRLSRILIADPTQRGKKLGEQIVRKMVSLFFEDKDIKLVDLNVFDWNKGAIACYQKVGFQINKSNSSQFSINGKSWKLLNMELKRN